MALLLLGTAATGPDFAGAQQTRLDAAPPGDHFLEAVLPDGETLLYTLHVPEGVERIGGRVPLVVALHYGGMAHPWIGGAYLHQLVLPALGATGAVIAAPDALPLPDAPYRTESWTSPRNEAAVLWLTRALMEAYPIDPARVAVTGYSRGGAGAWLMADRHRDLFAASIPVSATPAYQVVDRVGVPVFVIHSIHDEVIGSVLVQGAVEQLQQAGADVQLRVIRGPTHYQTDSFVPALAATVPWLEEAWRKRKGGG